MLNRELWLFINSFAGWLAALGTIGAVIVALYLARRDYRISLKVVVGIRLLFQEGVEERTEFFSLDVTNVGRRSTRITNLVMRDGVNFGWGWLRLGSQFVMIPPRNLFSATVPTTISDGERADYLTPWLDFVRGNRELLQKHFAGRFGQLRARLFRIGVATSAGGIFDARIEKELAMRFVGVARQARRNASDS